MFWQRAEELDLLAPDWRADQPRGSARPGRSGEGEEQADADTRAVLDRAGGRIYRSSSGADPTPQQEKHPCPGPATTSIPPTATAHRTAARGQPRGIPELWSTGRIPSSQMGRVAALGRDAKVPVTQMPAHRHHVIANATGRCAVTAGD